MPSYSAILDNDGGESIPVATSIATLTLPAHFSSAGVNSGRALIQVKSAPILYTLYSADPQRTPPVIGIQLDPGEFLILTTFVEMRQLKMVKATSKNSAVFVQYDRKIN